MESITELANDSLVKGLIEFYNKSFFTKPSVLEKVIEGILAAIAKLTDRQAMH